MLSTKQLSLPANAVAASIHSSISVARSAPFLSRSAPEKTVFSTAEAHSNSFLT